MPDAAFEILLSELTVALRPLVYATEEDPVGSGLKRLALETGYDLEGSLTDDQAVAFATAVATIYDALWTLVLDPEGFAARIPEVLDQVGQLHGQLLGLDDLLPAGADLGIRLFDYLVATYLEQRSPSLYALLVLFGVVRESTVPESGTIPEYVRREIVWEQLGALTAPEQVFAGLYHWGDAALDSNTLLARIADVLWSVGLPASYRGQPAAGTDGVLDLQWSLAAGAASALVGVQGGYLAADAAHPPGLEVAPSGLATLTHEVDLGDGWRLSLLVQAGATAGYGVSIQPGAVRLGALPGQPPVSWNLAGRLGVAKVAPPDGRTILFGAPGHTRLEAASAGVVGSVQASPNDGDAGVDFQIQRGQLVVTLDGADGFLQKILPPDGIVAGFDFDLGWSTSRGLHFAGSAGLEVTLALQLALGPLRIETATLALASRPDGRLDFTAAATADATLGPVAVAIDRVGATATLDPRPPFAVDVAFKAPAGAALSIDAGAVTGGGFLFHDEAKALYAGALHLEFEGISLNAVGLLTTRMPDGSTGFSLLVIVTAAGFTPIQLGFGFTLTGVGGLLGLNRTVAVDVLRAGLKSHSLDSILFARDDPTPRAAEIVSTLQSVFPPAPARYLFGPMAQIGWGTPTVVTLEIALLLELPAPLRLIILGRLRAVLPDEQAAVVRISLDVLGVIDFDARTVAVDGTLYDSFVGPFTLTGDLALRAGWGDPPAFALSIGGFHPAFRPPAGFPALRRLTLTLSSGDNARLRAELYLAVTSNTVQVGARLEFHYEAFGFALDGLFAFDALVNLAPFGFEVDIVAHLAILRGRTTLMGLDVRITLTGPTPWRVRGEAKFHVLFWDVSIPFDVTFGDTRAVPPPERVEVWPLLRDAIRDGRNWSALLPDESGRLVTLGAPPPAAGEALVHPYGHVAFAQRLLPLDRQLDLYGPAPPKDFGRFSIAGVVSARVAGARYDYFAPGQFTRLSDQEKLTRPSYERMPAGVELAGTGVRNGTEKPVPLSYETVVVAADGTAPDPVPAPLPGPALAASSFYVPDETTVAAHAEFGPAGNADTRHTGRQMFRAPGDPAVLDEPVYTVATRKDLARVPTTRLQDGSYSSALEALQAHLSEHPDAEGDLQVVLAHEAA